MLKGMFLPGLLDGLKHIEVHNEKQDDGSEIKDLIVDCKFPDISKIDLKVSEKGIHIEFPHFGMNAKGSFVDPMGGPVSLDFSIEDLSMTGDYQLDGTEFAEVDFTLDISHLKLHAHAREPQDLLNQIAMIGMGEVEQTMEKKTTRLLAEIFNTVPKRSLVSEHLGLEYMPNG